MQNFTDELYSNGMVGHPSGWDISADKTDDEGWTASAEKRIHSEVFEQMLAQTNPQYVRSEPRPIYLFNAQPYPHCDAAVNTMWEWLDNHAEEVEATFTETGRFDPGDGMGAFIPLCSSVKEKPAPSLAAKAGF
jgi:hypothetical protein